MKSYQNVVVQPVKHLDMTKKVTEGTLTSEIIVKVIIPDWVSISIFSHWQESTRKILLKDLGHG